MLNTRGTVGWWVALCGWGPQGKVSSWHYKDLGGRTYWLGWAHFISCSWVGRCEQECGKDPDQASQTHWVFLMTHYVVLPRAPHIIRCSTAQEHKVSLTAHQLKWAWQTDTLVPMGNGMACVSGAEHKQETHRRFPRQLEDKWKRIKWKSSVPVSILQTVICEWVTDTEK